MTARARVAWTLAGVLCLAALAFSCSGVRFYSQSIRGQLSIVMRRHSLESVIADRSVDAELRAKLEQVLEMREFASQELALPDNGSYRGFVELERPFAVWNVVATPELSVSPVVWCFPVAGCVSYRGYFSRQGAERFARSLVKKGHDTSVEGVAAYSTLGWFRDPVLSTFIDWDEARLAGLIFHELAHHEVYVKGDTVFNESFATAVELEGLERYLGQQGALTKLEESRRRRERGRRFAGLVLAHRARLETLFSTASSDDAKRRGKREIFAALKQGYEELRASWGDYTGYDAWFARDLNNAHLASVGAYSELVPAFEALLEKGGGDLAVFYDRVRGLAELSKNERRAGLKEAVSPPRPERR